MELISKKNKWQIRHERSMAILTILLLFVCLWRVNITERREIAIAEANRGKPKQLIILAGQSNMAGRGGVERKVIKGEVVREWDGVTPPESHRNPGVFRFSQHFGWELASEPMHQGIYCEKTCGVGIGMAFANKLLELDPEFGVIGLVPSAAGGTSVGNWTSDVDLPYKVFLMRARTAVKKGGVLRAVLWYQGETDSKYYSFAKGYRKNIEKLFRKMRSDLNSPSLPIFEVIIPRPKPPFNGPFTEDVRKAQAELDLPNVVKVDADGLPIGPDGIHLTTDGYVRLGTMLAEAVFENRSLLSPNNNNNTIVSNNTTSASS